MNLEMLGVAAEVVGAGAVVVSLIYLAVQIRAQNRESRIASMHDIAVGFREAISTFTSVDNADLSIRGNEDFDQLSDAEKLALISSWVIVFRVCEEAFIQKQEDRLDERSWAAMEKWASTFMSAPCVRKIWSSRRVYFDVEFQNFLDTLDTPTEYRLA